MHAHTHACTQCNPDKILPAKKYVSFGIDDVQGSCKNPCNKDPDSNSFATSQSNILLVEITL